jgi:hypothetical protein
MKHFSIQLGFLASALMPLLAGCDSGPKIVPVSGQVLIDGKPLQFGYVRFIPQDSRLSGGALDAEGRFKLTCLREGDGAVIGRHMVEVLSQKPLSETKIQWLAPKKFADHNTSGLSYEVAGPANNVQFNLTWDGGKPFVEIVEGSGQEGVSPY